LTPKFKELVYFAIDASTTHLHEPGMRLHARNALAFGASVSDLVEVAQLAATIGGQSFALGLPILNEVLSTREASA
jgi:alkylhydroperoxidase/carboxymuconolactone decarboxylase family protein YurZ